MPDLCHFVSKFSLGIPFFYAMVSRMNEYMNENL